jgi:hypothetical protein
MRPLPAAGLYAIPTAQDAAPIPNGSVHKDQYSR